MSKLEKHGRFFDAWSRFYRYTPLGRSLRLVQRIAIDRLAVRPRERVLDLGCGPGDGIRAIAARGGRAIGLDYSEGMLEKARANVGQRGPLLRGDAAALPFKDGSFDKVVCTNSFHHYPDQVSALAELRRVLRKGGLLVLVDPRADNLGGRIAIDMVERHLFSLAEVKIHSLRDWHDLLRAAGFEAADVRPGPLWRPVAHTMVFVEATP